MSTTSTGAEAPTATSAKSPAASEPAANASAEGPTHCFTISADADPGMLPRLMGALAKRGLTPSRVHAATMPEGDEMTVDLQVAGLTGEKAEIVGATLRAMVGVRAVLVAAKARRAETGIAA